MDEVIESSMSETNISLKGPMIPRHCFTALMVNLGWKSEEDGELPLFDCGYQNQDHLEFAISNWQLWYSKVWTASG